MKTINQYFLLMMLASLLAFTSCSDDIVREPSPIPTEGVQAYVYAEATNLTFVPTDAYSFTLNVARQNTQAAATVHLIAEGEGFTVPSSVDFAAGEDKKEVLIAFDQPVGSTRTLTISIPEEESYIYANAQITFTITLDYTWEDFGTGTYTSQLFGQSWPQPILKAKEGNVYKMPDCITEGYPITFTLSDDGQELIGWDIQPTGYEDADYGMVYFLPTGMTREGNVLSFPMQGLVVLDGGYGILYNGFVETLEMPAQ